MHSSVSHSGVGNDTPNRVRSGSQGPSYRVTQHLRITQVISIPPLHRRSMKQEDSSRDQLFSANRLHNFYGFSESLVLCSRPGRPLSFGDEGGNKTRPTHQYSLRLRRVKTGSENLKSWIKDWNLKVSTETLRLFYSGIMAGGKYKRTPTSPQIPMSQTDHHSCRVQQSPRN